MKSHFLRTIFVRTLYHALTNARSKINLQTKPPACQPDTLQPDTSSIPSSAGCEEFAAFGQRAPQQRTILSNPCTTKMESLCRMLFTLILSLCATSTIAFATPTPPSTNGPLRTVLVTGGAGYIGSHTCLELLQAGNYRVVVIDTLDNSSEESLNRVKQLTGCDQDMLHYRNCDIRDRDGLCKGECWAAIAVFGPLLC